VTVVVLTSEMIRKASVIAVLAAGLFAAMPNVRYRIAVSAQNFGHRFDDLKGAGDSLNPVERVVFSLALANATPPVQK
jgi:hypothetical protein